MTSSSTFVPVEMKTEMPSFSQEMGVVEVKTQMPPQYMPSAPEPQQQLNLPDGRLLGNREGYFRICVPLYEASVKGDWESAKAIIEQDGSLTRCSITENCETALHIAASAKSTKLIENFVSNLVSMMSSEDLELQNRSGNTALCLAAAGGSVSIARIIIDHNPSLLDIPGSQNMLPLFIAALYGKYDMTNYLYGKSNNIDGNAWTNQSRGWVLLKCVEADFYDIALKILEYWPVLASSSGVLGVLAQKTNPFREIKDHLLIHRIIRDINQYFGVMRVVKTESHSERLLNIIWAKILTEPKAVVDDIIRGPSDKMLQVEGETTSSERPQRYSSRVLFIAAENGNTNFLVELIRFYPDLIWNLNDDNQSIFHVAVSHRQEGVYNLMYEIGMKDFIAPLRDVDGNNMLHLAAMRAKNKRLDEIPGVALQLQRELLWYKEVEGMLPPSYQEEKNNAGRLPHELFTRDHKHLVSESEKWMKDTASHCMVVAALIATMVFAAAFTVPGGYDQEDGIPIFRHRKRKTFIIFVISDAISLTLATISILMFLYILTSRYAEQDFLDSLPKKLMRGLTTLFLSIVAMMASFSVSFFVLYEDDLIWVPTVITAFALVPVILFVRHEYGLLVDVYHATYGSKNLFKPKKPMLYP